jgi:hypothetical protein
VDNLDEKDLWYKPQKGTNLLDILPFIAVTDNSPRCKKGEVDYLLDVYVHKSVGPARDEFLCLQKNYGRACPICEHREELREQGEDEDVIKELYPKRRVLYNIKDLKGESKKIQLFETNHFQFELEIQKEAETDQDGEFVVFFDPEDGKSVKFRGYEDTYKGRKYIKIEKVSLENREKQYKESILEKTIALDSLLVVPSYEEVRDSFFGVVGSSSDDEDDETPKKRSKVIETDDDEDDDDRPKKKGKVDDEDDDEDDDDDDRPKKKGKVEEEDQPKKKSSSKCPHGHVFGKDCDSTDECEDCKLWDECSDEFTILKKKAKKNETED